MKTLLFLICLGLLSPASLVCMNSAPISRHPLSIFSMRMGLEQAPSPCPPLVLSKDKLLTSVKAFLINRRIRHGMSSGVQRVLIKEGGGPGHTSLPVGSFIRSVQHLSSWVPLAKACPPGHHQLPRPLWSREGCREETVLQWGSQRQGERERNQSRVAWVLTRAVGPKIFLISGQPLGWASPRRFPKARDEREGGKKKGPEDEWINQRENAGMRNLRKEQMQEGREGWINESLSIWMGTRIYSSHKSCFYNTESSLILPSIYPLAGVNKTWLGGATGR